jgi:hypothetical protein
MAKKEYCESLRKDIKERRARAKLLRGRIVKDLRSAGSELAELFPSVTRAALVGEIGAFLSRVGA